MLLELFVNALKLQTVSRKTVDKANRVYEIELYRIEVIEVFYKLYRRRQNQSGIVVSSFKYARQTATLPHYQFHLKHLLILFETTTPVNFQRHRQYRISFL